VRHFQVIWWWCEWRDWRPWFVVSRPTGNLRYIYRWSVSFGPLEIRRWEDKLKAPAPRTPTEEPKP